MARPEGYSKGACENCGGHIEFPSDAAGQSISCPHCSWPTVLVARNPKKKPGRGGKPPLWKRMAEAAVFLAAVLIVAAGGGYYYWVEVQHHSIKSLFSEAPPPAVVTNAPPKQKRPAKKPVQKANPDLWHGLMASPVKVEREGDGNLIYAIGMLTNSSDHQRFAVKVELDVFNEANEKVATASDYKDTLEAGKAWRFKALITDRRATAATIKSVKEE